MKYLGLPRLRIIQIFSLSLELNNPTINKSFAENNVFQNLFMLYMEYPVNNMLQLYVSKSVETVLKTTGIGEDTRALQKSLVEDCGLVEFLLKMSRGLEFKFSR